MRDKEEEPKESKQQQLIKNTNDAKLIYLICLCQTMACFNTSCKLVTGSLMSVWSIQLKIFLHNQTEELPSFY